MTHISSRATHSLSPPGGRTRDSSHSPAGLFTSWPMRFSSPPGMSRWNGDWTATVGRDALPPPPASCRWGDDIRGQGIAPRQARRRRPACGGHEDNLNVLRLQGLKPWQRPSALPVFLGWGGGFSRPFFVALLSISPRGERVARAEVPPATSLASPRRRRANRECASGPPRILSLPQRAEEWIEEVVSD